MRVDLGQVYTALSRAVTLDGLQVFNFSKSKVKVHPAAAAFYAALEVV
jgi:hypothetical protein